MALCDAELQALVANPFSASLPLDEILTLLTNEALGLPPVSEKLQFDVAAHRDAQSAVAKEMQRRLRDDAQHFAEGENGALKPKLKGLLDADFYRMCGETPDRAAINGTVQKLTGIKQALMRLRAEDEEYVTLAIPITQHVANFIRLPMQINPADAEDEGDVHKLMFYLRR